MATQIIYRLVKGKSLDEVQAFFNKDLQDETKVRKDDAETNREITAQLRGRGTVQSSRWTFKQRKPTEKWFVVVIRQGRDWNHPDVLDQEPYALVVTVADRDNEKAQLYAKSRQPSLLRFRHENKPGRELLFKPSPLIELLADKAGALSDVRSSDEHRPTAQPKRNVSGQAAIGGTKAWAWR
ncbi:S8A family peptidase [Pseudomonas sp. StFLB209]|uniref:hypothetical protein n=1 Tax=Pseudomonas sp. StFLB209 TaxID=1028989 RepID=UPI0004F75C33|nr:hypothetical protein [Pseudomonas sp. StFLB209]BAP42232.1 S8A family peptidase [Pseudomonas sp. StFLB209]